MNLGMKLNIYLDIIIDLFINNNTKIKLFTKK